MVETTPAAEEGDGGSSAAYGALAVVSGVVTVTVGATVAGSHPVLAAVLVGLPVGFGAWAGAREVADRTVGWPLADTVDPAVTDEDYSA
jgi:hypothetical protein